MLDCEEECKAFVGVNERETQTRHALAKLIREMFLFFGKFVLFPVPNFASRVEGPQRQVSLPRDEGWSRG